MSAGSEVRDGERVLGTIVSVSGRHALAVLPLEHDAMALHADGVAMREVPLLNGLER
jgi:hypothetical protein